LQIHRMLASFGKLQGERLELKDGLNIIQAPNETGKSTWCAFLLAMFYGINSRERDKAGFIAEKNRYAPWNGSPMEGRLDCRVNGTDITLTRSTRRQTAPMSDFKAVFSGTGTEIPDLTSQTCGEQLLGVNREVYERSAFIRQSGLSISQDAGLERRIASLITSGEEDTSYSETFDTLKKQLNRRRHNKTGQLPLLEAELESLRRQIAEQEQLDSQLKAAQMQIESLETLEVNLLTELELHRQWEIAEKHRALTAALSAAQQAEQRAAILQQQAAAESLPENETIGRLRGALVNLETTRRSVEKAREERDTAAKELLRVEAAVNESPFAGQTSEGARKSVASIPKIRPTAWWLPVIVALAGALLTRFIFPGYPLWAAAISGICCVIPGSLAMVHQRTSDKKKYEAYLATYHANSPEALSSLVESYIATVAIRDAAQAELEKKSAAADTLYNTLSANEQAILLEVRRFAPAAFDSVAADGLLRECARRRKTLADAETAAAQARMRYELLAQQTPPRTCNMGEPSAPARARTTVEAELEKTRSNLAVARSTADHIRGQLTVAGDPAILQTGLTHLEENIQKLECEYSAIRLAMDTLEQANTTLQNRFSPVLGQRAAEIFSTLTDGRYKSVVLDRAFHLSAEPTGDTLHRDAQLLSAGAVDQLYLATRLAICDMVLPAENAAPIILDDALANFDDVRCAAALRWLKETAKTRQILLFTCHRREADFFSGDTEVFVQRLTNLPKQV